MNNEDNNNENEIKWQNEKYLKRNEMKIIA
jgi:hypothetical protein